MYTSTRYWLLRIAKTQELGHVKIQVLKRQEIGVFEFHCASYSRKLIFNGDGNLKPYAEIQIPLASKA